MAAAIGLRDDYDAGALRAAAKRSKDGPQGRRVLALAAIYDGARRTAPGQPPRLNDEHRAALAAILESGPIPAECGNGCTGSNG